MWLGHIISRYRRKLALLCAAFALAREKGMTVSLSARGVDIRRRRDVIRISYRHFVYAFDMINWFDYYHAAVEPDFAGGNRLVDYSTCRRHRVRGFDLFPVMFNALAEPVVTTQQYLRLAPVPDGGVVIDLGGYSGLSSMIYALAAGERGRVICVEADPDNQRTIRENLATFRRMAPHAAPIEVEEKAIWKHNDGVDFSAEGNMGASVADLMRRGKIVSVPSITLSGLAGKYNLEQIDVIKCDIEGAEAFVFERKSESLQKYKPTILIEVHLVDGKFSSDYFGAHLEKAGYGMTNVAQDGASVPLVVARPVDEGTPLGEGLRPSTPQGDSSP